MSASDLPAELKQILGAMIFGANRPLTIREMRRCLVDVAKERKGDASAFEKVTPGNIRDALDALGKDLTVAKVGFSLVEVANGYRLLSDAACGKWLRHLLNAGRPNRLSRPALETLSIIAYRQPITRAEIESVRGVAIDHVIKALMELQLVRIVGRSPLPGRPFLYGTTQAFLEHFGLKNVDELSSGDPALKIRYTDVTTATVEVEAPGEEAHQDRSETDNVSVEGGNDDAG